MAAADRIAYYKWFRLGDYLLGPETITLEGEEMVMRPTLFATNATTNDIGPAGFFSIKGVAALQLADNETPTAFWQRKLDFLINARLARSYDTGTSTSVAGTFAVLDDSGLDGTLTENINISQTTPDSIVSVDFAMPDGIIEIVTATDHGLVVGDRAVVAGVTYTVDPFFSLNNGATIGGVTSPAYWRVTDVINGTTVQLAYGSFSNQGTINSLAAATIKRYGATTYSVFVTNPDANSTRSPVAVTSASLDGTSVLTVNFAANHGFLDGDVVTMSGFTVTGFPANGRGWVRYISNTQVKVHTTATMSGAVTLSSATVVIWDGWYTDADQGGGLAIAAGQYVIITDGVNYDFVTTSTAATTSNHMVTFTGLTHSYDKASTTLIFPDYWVTNAYLDPGISVEGIEPGTNQAVTSIQFTIRTLEDFSYQTGVTLL